MVFNGIDFSFSVLSKNYITLKRGVLFHTYSNPKQVSAIITRRKQRTENRLVMDVLAVPNGYDRIEIDREGLIRELYNSAYSLLCSYSRGLKN